ncbi:MAG: HEAT repeat domain-containing protein [Pseudomonadota bacterium]
MNNAKRSVFVSGLGMSFVLGFGLAWSIWAPGVDAPVSVEARSPAHPKAGLSQMATLWNAAVAEQATAPKLTLDEIWARGKVAKDSHQARMDLQEQLREKAQADPAALRSLIQRFDNERDPKARDMLKAVLSNIQSPDVLALSSRLAASGDPTQRRDAFDILKQLSSNSPEVRELLKHAMATEQAPAVLAQAIAALTPSIVAAGEADAIVDQLQTLARHSDPAVRSQSVLQLGQWDKSAQAESRLQQALADQSPEVRHAAVMAIGETGIRSDSMKTALFDIARSSRESVPVKDGALHALERFSLSKEEFVVFQQARVDLDKRSSQ